MDKLIRFKRFVALPMLFLVSTAFTSDTTQLLKQPRQPKQRQAYSDIDHMPVLRPDPHIDYTIQVIRPDPHIIFSMSYPDGNTRKLPNTPHLYEWLNSRAIKRYREMFDGDAAERALERYKESIHSDDVKIEALKKYRKLLEEFDKNRKKN